LAQARTAADRTRRSAGMEAVPASDENPRSTAHIGSTSPSPSVASPQGRRPDTPHPLAPAAPDVGRGQPQPGEQPAGSPSASTRAGRRRPIIRPRYPAHFLALMSATAGVVVVWVLDFSMEVLPALDGIEGQSQCAENDRQLERNCFMIVGFFYMFIGVRVLMHSGFCLGRIREQAEDGLMGPFRLYVFQLTVHGPLYVFCVTSALFVAQLMSTSQCEVYNADLYTACRRFAFLSCLTGNFCVSLVFWRGQLLRQARQRLTPGRGKRRAAPGAIEQLAAVPYDPALFGDEDGRRYAGECPICLGVWEPDDDIRVPPCGHAFHKECLGRWLQTDRTCALCRRDVTLPDDDLEAARRPEGVPTGTATVIGRGSVEPGDSDAEAELEPSAVPGAPNTLGAALRV